MNETQLTAVIAGSKRQFDIFIEDIKDIDKVYRAQGSAITRNGKIKYIYLSRPGQEKGMRFSCLIKTGTWHEKWNTREVDEILMQIV